MKHIILKLSYNLSQSLRWKMDFHVTQRVIDVMLSSINLRPKEKMAPLSAALNSSVLLLTDSEAPPSSPPASLSKQSDSFVRQSTKYWVNPVDLAAVCTALGEHMEVHTVEGGSPWTEVSSVYLDNMERKCYRDRQSKDTGARIVRLRTYDTNAQRVYVERKVHHERWTGEQSSKDRFTIDEQQIMQASFLCAFPLFGLFSSLCCCWF
jgi:SPX domain protein involved in polyphosphate accumulation